MAFILLLLLLSRSDAHDLSGNVYCWRDGKVRQVSTTGGATTPVWSPDGERLAYVRHDGFSLVSPAGEWLKTISRPLGVTGGLSWHPNGKEIAFAEEREGSFNIYRLNLDNEQVGQILADGIQPAWSPGGEFLAFTTYRDSNLEVYLADQEGRLRNLTRHDSLDARPTWSPDGTRIAFESNRYGNLEICVVELASGQTTRLTDHPGKDWNPVWSSTGEIAFVSDRENGGGIYRLSDRARLPSQPGDWQLTWSPDGTCLCFVSNRE